MYHPRNYRENTDPMRAPQLDNDPMRLPGDNMTFAQDYRQYIEYIHSSDFPKVCGSPLDSDIIY